jgi:GT2 family glycosyltransferase
LLHNILLQTVQPTTVFVVENVRKEKHFSPKSLQAIFSHSHVKTRYLAVKFSNIASSRELALRLVSTKRVVFMDDDTAYPLNHIENLIHHFDAYPNADAFVGRIVPQDNSIRSQYAAWLWNHGNIEAFAPKKIDFYGMAFVAMSMSRIRALRMHFDRSLHTGEDVDFFLTLNQKGGTLIYSPYLLVRHEFRLRRWHEYLLRYYEYGRNFIDIEKKHPIRFQISNRFPNITHSKLLAIWYVLYLSWRDIHRSMPRKYFVIAYMTHIAMNYGVYTSLYGRK